MDKKTGLDKCPNCGGIFPLNDFVCQYCGYVESEKLKQLSDTDTKEISFEESLNVIQDNLNALHEINKPTIKKGITGALRVILAIQTFGIILIFWRKPKKRFNKKSFDHLKRIIRRNIELLKVSSKGSDQLLNKIGVIENELAATDSEVKKNLKAKQLTTIGIVALYLLLIFTNGANRVLNHPVYPYHVTVNGDLSDTLNILQGSCKLKYYGNEPLEHFQLQVTLIPAYKFELKDSSELVVTLILTDTAGNALKDFNPSVLEGLDTRTLLREMKKGPRNNVLVEFDITEKKALDSIPENLTNFVIHTEIREEL